MKLKTVYCFIRNNNFSGFILASFSIPSPYVFKTIANWNKMTN